MFELPSLTRVAECIITPRVILGKDAPKYIEKPARRRKAE
jgi:hypothetical protein